MEPFIDRDGYLEFIDAEEAHFREKLAEQKREQELPSSRIEAGLTW